MTLESVQSWLDSRATGCTCPHCKAIDAGEAFPLIEPPMGDVERFRSRMNSIFGDIQRNIIESVATLPREAVMDAAIAEVMRKENVSAIADAFVPMSRRLMDAGGNAGASQVGSVFDGDVPEVDRWIETQTTRLAEDVRDGTVSEVQQLIGDGFDRGEGVSGVIDNLREQGFTTERSERIARTETVRAYNQGKIESWRQSGVVVGKKWSLSPDSCQFCSMAAAQFSKNAVGLDQAFYPRGTVLTAPSGETMKLDYEAVQGPPLHPNCRCTLIAEIEE